MTDPSSRLQLATRIHLLLVREIGQGIDLERMLLEPRYARDVLLVCDACKGTELEQLAKDFRRAMPPVPPRAAGAAGAPPNAGGRSPQADAWVGATTGFGVSRPLEDSELDGASRPAAAPRPPAVRRWLARWWR